MSQERQVAQQTQTKPTLTSGVLQRKCACGNHTYGGGECESCKKRRIQRREASTDTPETVPPIVHEVLRSPGQPLDAQTRAFMEPRFGHDFSGVRAHTDAQAAESARSINAQLTTRIFTQKKIPINHKRQLALSEKRESPIAAIPKPFILGQLRQTYFSGQVDHAASLVQGALDEGQPLPASVRTQMNRHFGRDFSRVRIHTDEFSSEASKALDANAFTIRNDIVFGSGMFCPETRAGEMRLAHELAHVIQQTGNATDQHHQLEQQADYAAVLGSPYLQSMGRMAPTIQREPTYPRRATGDQMIAEARRVLPLTRDPASSDDTVRPWSNVTSNFGTVTTGSIARRIWTHTFLRHFTEPESRPGVESAHPRYLYSHQYGWVDAQHFFGFIDSAEAQTQRNPEDRQAAFDATTEEGLEMEKKQQLLRNYVILQRPPARDVTRYMQVRPPNTPMFRVPVAAAHGITAMAVPIAAPLRFTETQMELFRQLNGRQQEKFFMDAAKSAFTYEDIVSNQLGNQFFFQYGHVINSAPIADRERMFLAKLSTFYSSIRVENDQRTLDQLARNLPPTERFAAPKMTEAQERQRHPELFHLPPKVEETKAKQGRLQEAKRRWQKAQKRLQAEEKARALPQQKLQVSDPRQFFGPVTDPETERLKTVSPLSPKGGLNLSYISPEAQAEDRAARARYVGESLVKQGETLLRDGSTDKQREVFVNGVNEWFRLVNQWMEIGYRSQELEELLHAKIGPKLQEFKEVLQ